MGQVDGFLKYERVNNVYESVASRTEHYDEFVEEIPEKVIQKQGARCMDCGIPFCHNACPLNNKIPDFNDAVYKGNWKEAFEVLKSTNNFPEFTGRICPAPCEASCVLSIHNDPVSIENIEKRIIEYAFEAGWEGPHPSVAKTGKSVAVIGSGPAGLAAADQLIKKGHSVVVFEKAHHPGGLLRYGIPDFKLDKKVVERRIKLMEASGVVFKTGVEVGVDVGIDQIKAEFDAILLCIGSTIPRNLEIPGRALEGVHYAMDFLSLQNQINSGERTQYSDGLNAKDKRVIVIGGGDTGSDCVGTSIRQGATSVVQIELMDKPGTSRATDNPWPEWPMILRTSTSQEEGCKRNWSILTKRFIGDKEGNVTGLETVEVEWTDKANFQFKEVENSKSIIVCDMALLAIGFVHPKQEGLLESLGIETDNRGNIRSKNYATNQNGVFSAGDCRRGQSLVVWAIREGRDAAAAVSKFLQEEVVLVS